MARYGPVCLTHRRVVIDDPDDGDYTSIPLEAVASCRIELTSFRRLLDAAALALAVTAVSLPLDQGDLAATGATIGFLFLLGFLVARPLVVAIASSGGHRIVVPVAGGQRQDARAFLEQLEQARRRVVEVG